MNLLLTCSMMPEFNRDFLELWNKFCIADWMPGHEIVSYLKFAPASSSASVDAIVFLQPDRSMDLRSDPDGHAIYPWEAPWFNAEISRGIRSLPENCAMRDGRKWKRIPQIVLTDNGLREPAYEGHDVAFVIDVTGMMLSGGYVNPITWTRIERVINWYHAEALEEYDRVGLFLVTDDHGLYRVKKAFHKKSTRESDFYFGGKDKRRFHGYVTVGRESEGIDYEALLFEQLLNDPKNGERQVHHFLEGHPDLLAEAMMGVPVSHPPRFPSNKQTADYFISPIAPRGRDWAKLLELKGPEANILDSKVYLHRGLSHAVTRALAQVNDYNESVRDPLNLKSVEKALGYVPEFSEKAVLIGRNPTSHDVELWDKRKAERPSVRIVTYDQILLEQHVRHAWRRRR